LTISTTNHKTPFSDKALGSYDLFSVCPA
jgi:hypothetical protein